MKLVLILAIASTVLISGCLTSIADVRDSLDSNIEPVEFVELDLDPIDKTELQEFWNIDQNFLEHDGSGRLAYRSFKTPYGLFNALDPPAIIDSEKQFFRLYEKSSPKEVDFSKQIILGYKLTGEGCSSNPEIRVKKIISEKTIRFIPKLNDSGPCEMAFQKWFFVAIPKLEEGYKIEIFPS